MLGEENIQDFQSDGTRKVVYAFNLREINHMKLSLSDELIKGAQTVFNQEIDENAKSTF